MRAASAWVACLGVVAVGVVGCSRHKSSLLLERQARGPIEEESSLAQQTAFMLEPVSQELTDKGCTITAKYAPPAFLHEFFSQRHLFGEYAGMNPYFPDQMVFYLKVHNHSGKRFNFNPDSFVLVDDRGNQYYSHSSDYTNALAEAKAPVSTLTRGVLSEAHPGYFGVGVPVGKILGKSQRRFALLKMSSFQSGMLYDGVIYDGFVAFWSPHHEAKQVTLILPDINTDYGPDGLAKTALTFQYQFTVKR